VWLQVEGVKRGRENPTEEGKALLVSSRAAPGPPQLSAEGEGPVLSWLRRGGSGRRAEAAACGAAPVSEEKQDLKFGQCAASDPEE